MDILYERVAGLDVHKDTVVACVRILAEGNTRPTNCPAAATKQPVGQDFAFAVGQIIARTPAILSRRKGRWPSSPNVGMGLRWTRRCRA
jgi:hypothetical protein